MEKRTPKLNLVSNIVNNSHRLKGREALQLIGS